MLAAYLEDLRKFRVKEVPTPECGNSNVLVKVMACAVCGTDLRIYLHGHRKVKFPWIIGHEVSGIIVEIGKDVRSKIPHLKEGMKVQVVPGISCGKCDNCLRGLVCSNMKAIGYDYPGGFEQYLLLPEEAVLGNNLLPIPSDMDFANASLAEPISCVINGQEIIGGIDLGDTVVVVGLGPIGVVHAKLAIMQGASLLILIDVVEDKLEIAEKILGNKNIYYLNSSNVNIVERILDMTAGKGVNKVIISCSSKSAQEDALKMVGSYGKILYFGGLPPQIPVISFDSNALHYKSASVYGTFGSTVFQQKKALELIYHGLAEGLVTHKFPLTRINEAFEVAVSGRALKVIIEPW